MSQLTCLRHDPLFALCAIWDHQKTFPPTQWPLLKLKFAFSICCKLVTFLVVLEHFEKVWFSELAEMIFIEGLYLCQKKGCAVKTGCVFLRHFRITRRTWFSYIKMHWFLIWVISSHRIHFRNVSVQPCTVCECGSFSSWGFYTVLLRQTLQFEK